jgi:hypothetical protein
MRRKIGTFDEFKEFTLARARGERKLDPSEPKVWSQSVEGAELVRRRRPCRRECRALRRSNCPRQSTRYQVQHGLAGRESLRQGAVKRL